MHVFNIYFPHSKLISLQKLPGWKKDSEITPVMLKSSSCVPRSFQIRPSFHNLQRTVQLRGN